MNRYMIIPAALVLALILSIPGFNLYHNLSLPEIKRHQIETNYTWNFNYPFIHKTIEVYLEEEIHSQQGYVDIMKELDRAEKGDRVIFYISGYGGEVQATYYLINKIKYSKAATTMHVTAPAYSAHAYLALSGTTDPVIDPYSFLMFHMSSIWNVDCNGMQGTDRAMEVKDSCQLMKNTELALNAEVIIDMPLLTNEEKIRIVTGKDTYVTAEQLNKRLGNN